MFYEGKLGQMTDCDMTDNLRQLGCVLLLSAVFKSSCSAASSLVDKDSLERVFRCAILNFKSNDTLSPTISEDARMIESLQSTMFQSAPSITAAG